MQEKLKSYVRSVGLQISNSGIGEKFVEDLKFLIGTEPIRQDVEKLLSYKIPKLSPDGSCSIADELDDRPYDLKNTLQANGFKDEESYSLVGKLDKIVEFLHNEVGADWTGIYKKLNTKSGPTLIKLTYRGNPSRAEFPLTKEFAEHSNNSTVGLNGKAVLVNNVQKYIAEGKPYYECDNKVQSELCVPIFSENKEVVGIIDIESFKENFFDDQKIINIAIACILLSGEL